MQLNMLFLFGGFLRTGFLAAMMTAAAAPLNTASMGTSATLLPRTQRLIDDHKPVCVVIYGDSISEVKKDWSGGASTPESNWGGVLVKQLNEAYPHSTFTAQHFAISGQNSYEGLGRLNDLEAFKPDLVLVAFGANDCGFHYLIPEETKAALTTLATEIRARYGADVVLVGTGGDNPLKSSFKHLDETIAAQRQAAANARAPFVDIRSAVLLATENGKNWAEFHLSESNCHPTDKGHRIWAEAAFKSIQESLSKPN